MKNKIFFNIFMLIWIFLIILNFIVPKQDFSEQENRYLARIPKFNFEDLIDGSYVEKLDNYINDHFIFRKFWLKLNSFVQIATGKTENNDVYIGKDGYLFEKFNYTETDKRNLENAVKVINNFANKTNIPTYFLLVPNSIYINKDKLPNNVEIYDQGSIINSAYNKCNSNVKKVNVLNTLKSNKNLDLYFKTDHHITSLGAYLLYKEFCDSANIKCLPLSEYKKEVVSTEFLGTFDSKAQVLNQKADEIIVYKNQINQNVKGNYDGKIYDSLFNEEYLQKKDKYSYFLNGNNAQAIIKTQLDNNKKLLVIKDSYAHILSQFICQNYEEIHFIDPRYYNLPLSKYIENNEITETLFLYNLSNLLIDTGIRGVR